MTVGLDIKAGEPLAPAPKHRQPQKRRVIVPHRQDEAEPTLSTVQRITTNRLLDRADMTRLLRDLLTSLETCQSAGGARVKLGHGGAGFDPVAAELEGYARALWGLGPLLASEPDHPAFRTLRAKWVEGLINGTDPNHPEYWGDCQDRDQRLVEQAAIVSDKSQFLKRTNRNRAVRIHCYCASSLLGAVVGDTAGTGQSVASSGQPPGISRE